MYMLPTAWAVLVRYLIFTVVTTSTTFGIDGYESCQRTGLYQRNKQAEEVNDFQNGDQTSTLIRTEKGKTILIQHNVMTPRPYSRMYQIVGADGYASKYPIEEYCLRPSQVDSKDVPNHENLNAHGSVPEDVKKALMDKYKNPIHIELEETAKKVGGHGGMDYIMDYRSGILLAEWTAIGYGRLYTWQNGVAWLN